MERRLRRERLLASPTTSTPTTAARTWSASRARSPARLNNYATAVRPRARTCQEPLQGEDTREGLTAVISVKVPNPQFEGQTKGKLGNSEVKGIVESLMGEQLCAFLEENPPVAKRIV